MSIQIYNSLTKTKEEFIPCNPPTVKMYCCGVTVYDVCHLGHARSLYIFDVIRRYLKYRGYDVQFIRNITDVDDKIIARALELRKTSDQVAVENIQAYRQDLKNLNVAEADVEPRATENVAEMVKHIEALIQKGFAYVIGKDVYFSVRKFKDYGKLSGQSIDQMLEGVRIEPNSRKKDPLDFALWKESGDQDPGWPSPWGRGRPGWHIECSVMSMKFLRTPTLDIHAGGRDLIFPHHENEIAQSEALTGKCFAKYWIHHGLLTINGQKMSKSLGNFVTVQDALRKYPLEELKWFFLLSHYASPIDFSDEKMAEAHKSLERVKILLTREKAAVNQLIETSPVKRQPEGKFIDDHKERFLKAMDDDFNTPAAIGQLFDLVNQTHKFIDTSRKDATYFEVIDQAVDTIKTLVRDAFGISLEQKEESLSAEEARLLTQRQAARQGKDFQRSDELRVLLKQRGIVVEDTKDGQIWRRG